MKRKNLAFHNKTPSTQSTTVETNTTRNSQNRQTNTATQVGAVKRLLTQARGNNTEAVSHTLARGWADWCNVGARRLEGSLPSCVHNTDRQTHTTIPTLYYCTLSTIAVATVTPCCCFCSSCDV